MCADLIKLCRLDAELQLISILALSLGFNIVEFTKQFSGTDVIINLFRATVISGALSNNARVVGLANGVQYGVPPPTMPLPEPQQQQRQARSRRETAT